MYIVKNNTPYTADAVLLPDKDGTIAVAAVIKATFTFSATAILWIAETQLPLCYGDEYWGEPGISSLRYPTDMVYEKTGTDIIVNGHAYVPGFAPVKESFVTIRVGSFKKSIAIRGDRFFTSHLGFVSKTAPIPFVKMPLRYERAFGGTDTSHPDPSKHGVFNKNPVGVGFRSSRSKTSAKGVALPNIEDVKNPVRTWNDRPEPVGFGCIPLFWEPRHSHAGTYDETWKKDRMPLPPRDTDLRYHNSAHPDLILPKPLSGKEKVTLINLHPAIEKLVFTLPDLVFTAAFTFDNETVKPRPVLDTLIVEPDENRFILVYRAVYKGPVPISHIRQVVIYEERK
ncbi:MAG: DUF2169 domain-containing protein [Desulfobacteraceae bacterium]